MISVSNVTFQYGSRQVLGGITFSLAKGEVASFLGKSGCGKTTLLRCIAGLLKVAGGSILIDGLSPTEAARRQKIGYMFQEDTLLAWRTVAENISLPFELGSKLPLGGDGPDQAIRDSLELVGLENCGNMFPHELSGGMRQRVALARALAPRPSVLLLDEPFAALDLITREQIMTDLYSIFKKAGTPVVIVTHHVEEAVFLSDRVNILEGEPSIVRNSMSSRLPLKRDADLLTTELFQLAAAETKQALRASGSERNK